MADFGSGEDGKERTTAEKIAAEVENLLKGQIEGLETVTVQVDRLPSPQAQTLSPEQPPQGSLSPYSHHNSNGFSVTS